MVKKNSKYFFNLEKRNYKQKNRFSLTRQDGSVITENKLILEEQHTFFKNLFTSEKTDSQIEKAFKEQMTDIKVEEIKENEKINFEEDFNIAELKAAVFKMKKDKVPGNDGLPIEFYQVFWDQLKFILLKVCNKIIEEGMYGSLGQIVIALMDKGKDPNYLTNWRPISLLNCDAKIYSKMIASRLNHVMQEIVHTDQTGFIRNRYIHENLLDLMSIIDYVNYFNMPYILISYDFKKAFDMVEYRYIDLVLEKFNFGNRFRQMVRSLHINTFFSTINCGYTSKFSSISRGLRQGNPASSLIFDLIVELLGERIRTNTEIKGITLPTSNRNKKHSQYADDLWSCIRATQSSYTAILNIFKEFEQVSGLVINYNKTEVMRLGSLRYTNAKLYSELPIQWSTTIKILGITISADREEMIRLNYESMILKMQKRLNPWLARSLTLIGKILICNTLITLQAIYKFLTISNPTKDVLGRVKKIVTNFLWEGKKPKIAYSTLIKDYSEGGLRLADLEIKNIAMKAKWVKKSITTSHIWKEIGEILLQYKIPEIFECNLKLKDFPYGNQNWIILDIWKAWSQIMYKSAIINPIEIVNQPIWYNSHIKSDNKILNIAKYQEKGIMRIADIYNTREHEFLSVNQFRTKYNIANYLEYYKVIKAIPKDWKYILKNGRFEGDVFSPMDLVFNEINITKKIYWLYMDRKKSEDPAYLKWKIQLNLDISIEQWEDIRRDCLFVTTEVKLKWFQYRLISGRLTTNIIRSVYNSNVSPMCTFCNHDKETTLHIMYECQHVNKIWAGIIKWLGYILEEQIDIDVRVIILNNYKGKWDKLINNVLVIVKQYIYASKCKNVLPSFLQVTKNILSTYLTERSIAEKEGNVRAHELKWKKYSEFMF